MQSPSRFLPLVTFKREQFPFMKLHSELTNRDFAVLDSKSGKVMESYSRVLKIRDVFNSGKGQLVENIATKSR